MGNIDIVHHFTESMSEATQAAVKSEAEKLNLDKVYAYNGDTPASEGTFEIYAEVDTYLFSIDNNGKILS